MPIRWKFKEFLEVNDINVHSLSNDVKISITTLYSLKNSRPRRLDLDTLEELLPGLERHLGRKLELSELLEYERDEPRSRVDELIG